MNIISEDGRWKLEQGGIMTLIEWNDFVEETLTRLIAMTVESSTGIVKPDELIEEMQSILNELK